MTEISIEINGELVLIDLEDLNKILEFSSNWKIYSCGNDRSYKYCIC